VTVSIGGNGLFGPSVQIYTATHPLDADERRREITDGCCGRWMAAGISHELMISPRLSKRLYAGSFENAAYPGIFPPMTRKTQILLVTHLLALGVGYGLVRQAAAVSRAAQGEPPEYTKLVLRDSQSPAGDGDALLADFLDEQSGRSSRYQELKATLPVAKDLRGAVISAVEGLGGADWRLGLSEGEKAARLAEVEVRVLHWMRENPVAAMGFIINDEACGAAGLPALMNKNVYREIVSESGVLKSVGWLAWSEAAFPTLCAVALDEIRGGGGFGMFVKLEEAISRSPKSSEFRAFRAKPLALGNPTYDGERFLQWVGGAVRYAERDKLLEKLRHMSGTQDQLDLLSGFARTSGPAAEWLLGLLERGELDRIVAKELQPDLSKVALEVVSVDLGRRLDVLRKDPSSEGKSRQELVNELVAADVRRLLEKGRDWRFEFRYGMATTDDILGAVRGGLPGISTEGEEAMRITLYRQLAEENPKKALALLDPFPEEKRRAILLNSTWQSHLNVSPNDFLRFLADVPDAKNAEEQELKIKGWNWKVRGNLWRYGDDYVEWVMKMPPGLHKEAAMNSILWATSEQNPAAARELSEQFYPRQP
jgi:hypothetical protein